MHKLNGGSWVDISEGCPLHCTVAGSNEAHLLVGDAPHQYELTFDMEPMRDLVAKATAALAEMDALTAKEEAEWDARQRAELGQAAERSA